jgi:small subunit ribosomal protein S21
LSFERAGSENRTIASAGCLTSVRRFDAGGHRARSRHIETEGGVTGLAEIRIQDNESIESALRRFKRKVQQEDIIKEIKKHSFYMKPGDKRRAKQALARKRQRKKQRREQTD